MENQGVQFVQYLRVIQFQDHSEADSSGEWEENRISGEGKVQAETGSMHSCVWQHLESLLGILPDLLNSNFYPRVPPGNRLRHRSDASTSTVNQSHQKHQYQVSQILLRSPVSCLLICPNVDLT